MHIPLNNVQQCTYIANPHYTYLASSPSELSMPSSMIHSTKEHWLIRQYYFGQRKKNYDYDHPAYMVIFYQEVT